VIAGAATRWVWVAGAGPDVPRLELALAGVSGVRVALGTTATGVDGFRRSHLEASATQRLLIRTASRLRFAAYEDVQVVALVTQDPQRAQEFVTQTLGELAHASLELRETVRTYLQQQSNATSTAALLFTHRNTVLSRLARAEQLLPRPLAGSALRVGLALEVLHWQGANA
jgi:DNA-binding PucR family transcriptional regulator